MCATLKTRSGNIITHLHGVDCVVSVVVDWTILVLGRGVPEASDVHHVTVVESHKHGQHPRGRMHWLRKQDRRQKNNVRPNKTHFFKCIQYISFHKPIAR